ncbi:MAG: hypothetical protein KF880_07995 [Ferruginibacter sp.]|nr:hypothetical protein [Ferruginibacter sp.]
MKYLLCLLAATSVWLGSYAQTPKVTWGEPIKVKKGTVDLDIIHVEKSGVYLQENHIVIRRMAFVGPPSRISGTLIKLDKNLNEIYRNAFDKELQGKNFESFVFAGNKLFLFATAVKKGSNALELFGVEIDKATGSQKSDWKSIISIKKQEGVSNILFSLRPNTDSTAIALTTGVEYNDRAEFGLTLIDSKLAIIGKTLEVEYPINPKEFVLESMLYSPEGNVLVVNKIMEYREGKKKTDKFLDFKEYDIRLYNKEGNLISQVNVDGNGTDSRHIVQSKVVLKRDGNFTMGAFYSKQKKGSIQGVLFVTIDGKTGEVLNRGSQELSSAMLVSDKDDNDDDDDDDKVTRKEAKENKRLEKLQEEDDKISRFYKIKDILSLENGSFILLAEHYYIYTVSHSTMDAQGRMTTTNQTYDVHGKLMFVKVNTENVVEWIQMLPKKQVAQIASRNAATSGVSVFVSRIPPTHGSIGTMVHPANGNTFIFFNDHPKNASITNAGQKAKTLKNVAKSDCFMLELNSSTGNFKRKMLFTNDDIPDAMPSKGSQFGNTYYMTGKRFRMGKTLVAVAKITIQ